MDDVVTTVAAGAMVYLAILVMGRLVGVRSFSQLSTFDFTITLAIASVFGATVANGSLSVLKGVTALIVLFGLQYGVAAVRRMGWAHRLLDNDPVPLVVEGELDERSLRRSRVSEDDLRGAIRGANIGSLKDVSLAVAETTGTISVVGRPSSGQPVDEWLLGDLDG